MVKLTEVEDEHFTTEKPTPSKNDVLLASDDDDDEYTDTGEWWSLFRIFYFVGVPAIFIPVQRLEPGFKRVNQLIRLSSGVVQILKSPPIRALTSKTRLCMSVSLRWKTSSLRRPGVGSPPPSPPSHLSPSPVSCSAARPYGFWARAPSCWVSLGHLLTLRRNNTSRWSGNRAWSKELMRFVDPFFFFWKKKILLFMPYHLSLAYEKHW